MPLPNFFIIGAPKAGTTSLYYYLRDHPEIYFNPTIKEPRFFAYDENNAAHASTKKRFPIRSMDNYLALFRDVDNEKIIGDASPGYLHSQLAARRIKELMPEARILDCLRNPVERSYSAYLMSVRSGKEKRPIEVIPPEEQIWWHSRSTYYKSLKRYYDIFGFDQVKTILFDDLKLDSSNIVADIFRFLDVDQAFMPNTRLNYNPGGIPRIGLIHRMSTAFNNQYVKRKIKSIVPNQFHRYVISIRSKNLIKPPELSLDLRNKWLAQFRDDILRTQDLIDRDLSHWLTETTP